MGTVEGKREERVVRERESGKSEGEWEDRGRAGRERERRKRDGEWEERGGTYESLRSPGLRL